MRKFLKNFLKPSLKFSPLFTRSEKNKRTRTKVRPSGQMFAAHQQLRYKSNQMAALVRVITIKSLEEQVDSKGSGEVFA